MTRRIFVSAQIKDRLTSEEAAIVENILEKIRNEGYQLERFYKSGEAEELGWSFANAERVINKCIGAIFIVFPTYSFEKDSRQFHFTGEAVHYEGGIVNTHNIPLLIISDARVQRHGITSLSGGQSICFIPSGATTAWLKDDEFIIPFSRWMNKLKNRKDVFFGYSSQAASTANKIMKFLMIDLKLKVLDWEQNFTAGQSILQEIETAAKECAGGIFLFTKDDTLEGTESVAAPRDNVVFEAGFFIHAKGKDKVLIIREASAKMPADLGGDIYLKLDNREQTALIENNLRKFIEMRL